MNDQIKESFPHPPAFYKNYTDENIELFNTGEENCDFNLRPPEVIEGNFTVFGQVDNIEMKLASLEELGIAKLEPEESLEMRQDPVKRLKEINHSLLLNFLQLINTLVVDSSKAAEKTEHIKLLLIHMHHSINEYRPHQARDTLKLIMKNQIERRKAATEAILKMCNEKIIN